MRSHMKLIRAMVRRDKLEALKDALEQASVPSITVIEVRYRGPEKRHVIVFRGHQHPTEYLEKLEIEMVVNDDDVDQVVDTIIRTARTGTPGDGHVSVLPLEDRYSILTGRRDIC
jgi:nitrogen regulatory protein P-II 1